METSILVRQLLRTPASCRAAFVPSRNFAIQATSLPHARYISTPTILRPSFWASMVPKPLKERASAPKSREWNPATPYIILSLLVGSQAIQILWLKQERAHSLRKAEAKIGLLREVIERLQKGEDVDVEGVLGTGRDADEKEWAEVLKDIQEEEVLFQDKKKRKAMRELAASQASEQTSVDGTEKEQGQVKVESIGGVKFY